jgi:hypothetical protein
MWTVSALLIAMAFKHYFADFVLQTNWIACGKQRRRGWLAPLAVHVLGHGAITLAIALVVAPRLWWLALVDIVVHGSIDRAKSAMGNWGGWPLQDFQAWWLLGLDQFLHQATNVALVVALFVL